MSKDEVEQKIYMFFVCQFCLNDQILVLLYYIDIEKYYEVIIDFMIIVYIYICLFVYVFNYLISLYRNVYRYSIYLIYVIVKLFVFG